MGAESAARRVPQPRSVRVVEDTPGVELWLVGRLDASTAPGVRARLHRAVDGGEGDLRLHLGEAFVADAGALGVIVGTHRLARLRGRRLVLLDVPARLERLLRATRLHRVLVRV